MTTILWDHVPYRNGGGMKNWEKKSKPYLNKHSSLKKTAAGTPLLLQTFLPLTFTTVIPHTAVLFFLKDCFYTPWNVLTQRGAKISGLNSGHSYIRVVLNCNTVMSIMWSYAPFMHSCQCLLLFRAFFFFLFLTFFVGWNKWRSLMSGLCIGQQQFVKLCIICFPHEWSLTIKQLNESFVSLLFSCHKLICAIVIHAQHKWPVYYCHLRNVKGANIYSSAVAFMIFNQRWYRRHLKITLLFFQMKQQSGRMQMKNVWLKIQFT